MGWNDAFGWGKFPGHGGMAILSRLPIDAAAARSFRRLLWRDLPSPSLPTGPDGLAVLRGGGARHPAAVVAVALGRAGDPAGRRARCTS